MVILLTIALCLALAGLGYYIYKFRKKELLDRSYQDLLKAVSELAKEKNKYHTEAILKKEEYDKISQELVIAEERRKAAAEIAGKELELEKERRLSEFKSKLIEEEAALRATSNIEKLRNEYEMLTSSINAARSTMKIYNEEAKKFEEESDFIVFHSLHLTQSELQDVETIKRFAPNLNRQEAFCKLIWTEYYQKLLQKLCKDVNAEKVCGIYCITNINTKQKYIGQSVNIADRWKQHVKIALGVGSTANKTNKFYRAMYEQGPENFTFEVLEEVPATELNKREKYYIDFFDTVDGGYNSKIGG